MSLTAADALRSFAPSGLKRAVADLLTAKPVDAFIRAIFFGWVPHYGAKIWCGDRPGLAASLFWKLYERREIYLTRHYLRPDLDVVELGSSIGVNTVQIARRLEQGRKVVAVEADPVVFEHLRSTRQENLIFNTVLVNKAIDCDAQDAFFVRNGEHIGGRVGGSGGEPIRVPAITLSALLAEHQVADYTLVCDIEGAEVPLLLKDAAALKRCQMILIEMHSPSYEGRTYSEDEVAEMIEGLGFKTLYRYGTVAAFSRTN